MRAGLLCRIFGSFPELVSPSENVRSRLANCSPSISAWKYAGEPGAVSLLGVPCAHSGTSRQIDLPLQSAINCSAEASVRATRTQTRAKLRSSPGIRVGQVPS